MIRDRERERETRDFPGDPRKLLLVEKTAANTVGVESDHGTLSGGAWLAGGWIGRLYCE